VVLVLDGRGVGRGGTALMLHGISTGRALPRAWRVRHAPKGPLPDERPLALLDRISGVIPAGTPVVVLGDGAGEGTRLQHTLQPAGWSSACRTATSPVATWERETFRRALCGAGLQPGRRIAFQEVHGTREA
jgi:hypothetical protein